MTNAQEPAAEKQCTRCKETKPLDQFHNWRRGRYGKKSECIPCGRERKKRQWAEMPEEKRTRELARIAQWGRDNRARKTLCARARKYGLSADELEEMEADAEGRCYLCRKVSKFLVVDHDHNTEVVRRLLCRACNLGLGNFEDDPDLLIRAAEYIRSYRSEVYVAQQRSVS